LGEHLRECQRVIFFLVSLPPPANLGAGSLWGAITPGIPLFCRDFHVREFEVLGQAFQKGLGEWIFLQTLSTSSSGIVLDFVTRSTASGVVVSKLSPSGESVRFPTRNSRFETCRPRARHSAVRRRFVLLGVNRWPLLNFLDENSRKSPAKFNNNHVSGYSPGRAAQISTVIGPHLAGLQPLVDSFLPKPANDTITQRQSELLERRAAVDLILLRALPNGARSRR
jgi:hypothetical protein